MPYKKYDTYYMIWKIWYFFRSFRKKFYMGKFYMGKINIGEFYKGNFIWTKIIVWVLGYSNALIKRIIIQYSIRLIFHTDVFRKDSLQFPWHCGNFRILRPVQVRRRLPPCLYVCRMCLPFRRDSSHKFGLDYRYAPHQTPTPPLLNWFRCWFK